MPEDSKTPPPPAPSPAPETETKDSTFDDSMKAAAEVMEQYKNALRKLAE